MFLRFFSSITQLQRKRSFKRKIVFEKVAFGLWVDKLQVESWLLVPFGPSVNATKWLITMSPYLRQGFLQHHVGIFKTSQYRYSFSLKDRRLSGKTHC